MISYKLLQTMSYALGERRLRALRSLSAISMVCNVLFKHAWFCENALSYSRPFTSICGYKILIKSFLRYLRCLFVKKY